MILNCEVKRLMNFAHCFDGIKRSRARYILFVTMRGKAKPRLPTGGLLKFFFFKAFLSQILEPSRERRSSEKEKGEGVCTVATRGQQLIRNGRKYYE